jgi:hypothetical protein
MSGGDGMDFSTRVPICQVRVGVCGYVLSCHALNGAALQGPGRSGASRYWRAPGNDYLDPVLGYKEDL